jgi:hypothetical protein
MLESPVSVIVVDAGRHAEAGGLASQAQKRTDLVAKEAI